jgi:hypothetical protein
MRFLEDFPELTLLAMLTFLVLASPHLLDPGPDPENWSSIKQKKEPLIMRTPQEIR